MNKYKTIQKCRVGQSKNIISVLNLGDQALTGVFPKSPEDKVTSGPLELVWCPDSGLLQLRNSYDLEEMYGDNYGYRSGLNKSMVQHLSDKIHLLERVGRLEAGDTVLDIGSNDATLLKAYATQGVKKVGIDPTGNKFKRFYTGDISLVPEFFSKENYFSATSKKAKIVTSIAMFYDLEDPKDFAAQIESVLADDGIWHLEQSYMPSMLRLNSYDTICHEHLEFYSLGVIDHILQSAGLKIIDVGMNNVNGGSFAITACKADCMVYRQNSAVINWLLRQEDRMGLNTPRPFRDFEERVYRHKEDLVCLIRSLVEDGKTVLGYGASTKGNVVLQFCGFTAADIPAIVEVNPDKFGRVTPGSHIPIISEEEGYKMNPDYFLVLPWHFKSGIVQRERKFLQGGGKFIIPFPEIEII